MGMQIHFDLLDLPSFKNNPVIMYDYETESYSYCIDVKECDVVVGVFPNEKGIIRNACHDIGSASYSQMGLITYLIKNRVPFQAS